MKTLILYKSKYGSTKQYAEYLNQNIKNSDLVSIEDFKKDCLNEYDSIILGSSTYMGQIQILKELIDMWESIKEKKVSLFAVGLIDPDAQGSQITYNNIPDNIRGQIKYIKVPGRLNLRKLNIFEKLVAKAMTSVDVDTVDVTKLDSFIDKD
jgi:menaquinone-dependent protoporphyrinogen IX oxidase